MKHTWVWVCSALAAPGGGCGGPSPSTDPPPHATDAQAPPDAGAEDRVPSETDADAEDARPESVPSCEAPADPLSIWQDTGELDLVTAPVAEASGTLRSACEAHGYRVVAAAGMRLRVEARAAAMNPPFPMRVALYGASALSGALPGPLTEAQAASGSRATLDVALTTSGETLLIVHTPDLHASGSYALQVRCLSGCELRATRFPIVLLHGFGGWGSLVGALDYYYGVESALEAAGYDVHCPVADAVSDTPGRARQFAAQLEEIRRTTQARKLNLVAHSQAGLDARHIISTLGWGDRIGALVMVSTPNLGTPVADALSGDMPVSGFVLAGLLDAWGAILGGTEANTRAAFAQMTTAYLRDQFNPVHPDDPRVLYWSWAGRTCGMFDFDCQADNSGESVDPLLSVSYGFLKDEGPNDGLVPVQSAEWGTFVGTIPADHWDEVGQLADSGPGGPFDHLRYYLDMAGRLHAAGL